MQLFNRFSRLGTGQCTKPVYFFSSLTLTVTLIFLALILAGCTTPTPILRNFELITLSYHPSKEPKSIIPSLDSLLKVDKSGTNTFSTLRVGYRGVCILSSSKSDSSPSWKCTGTGSSQGNFESDPLDLVAVGDLYKDHISFSTPVWAATILFAIAWIMVSVNNIPFIPIPPVTRKIAGVAAVLGSLVLLGAMVLQQVTMSAVVMLVKGLGLGVVDIEVGKEVTAFGWAAFAVGVLGSVGCAAVAVAEIAVERVKGKAGDMMEKRLGAEMGNLGESSRGVSEPKRAAINLATKVFSKR